MPARSLIFRVPLGSHVYVDRGLYSHHGIWLGESWVCHYSGEPTDFANAEVVTATAMDFSRGARIRVRDYPSPFEPDEISARALSRLGERRYDLLGNNCEHYATWCRLGSPRSEQVNSVIDAFIKSVKQIFLKKT